MVPFLFVAVVLSLCVAFFGLSFLKFSRGKWTERALSWPRRPIFPGALFGSAALIWSAYEGRLMLEGSLEGLRGIVVIITPILIILCIWLLSYLNARGVGGFFIIAANYLTMEAFIHDVPVRGLYSAICLMLGLIGMVGIGAPWHVRNALEWLSQHPSQARGASLICFLIALLLVAMPLFARA